MSWHKGELFAFDTESTGKNPLEARIVTACAASVTVPTNTINATEWIINPGVEIPDEAAAIHGVTTEMARLTGRKPAEAVAEIAEQITDAWLRGVPVVGHNVVYDLTILNTELGRHGYAPLDDGPVIDTLLIDKHCDRYRRGKRTLSAACEHYRIPLPNAHDATADAVAAARLAWRLVETFPDLQSLTLGELHDAQIHWAVEQANGLREHFERQGKPVDDIDGTWPVRKPAEVVA